MKIALIGPSYPFRGGIPLNTTLLFKALKIKHNVLFISFKRQYPKILFPGKSDKEPEFTFILEKEAKPVIDSLNPFSWIKAAMTCISFNASITIIPWWVTFWFPHFFTIITLVKLFSKTKIMIICHNVFEHEDSRIKRFFSGIILGKADYLVIHSEEDRKRIRSLKLKGKVFKLWLPVFEYKPWQIKKEDARKSLKLKTEGKIITYFGIIRPYKGLKYLLKALAIVKNKFDFMLCIIGEFWSGKEDIEKEINKLGIKENVCIIDEFVPSDKIGVYISAAELVILPYISATGSGALQIALSCGKPVIATNVGCFPDLIKHGQTGFIVEAGNPEDMAEKIIKFYSENLEEVFSEKVRRFSKELSLEAICKAIDEFIASQQEDNSNEKYKKQ